MRERWFGDDRDLVKWSSLIHAGRQHGVSRILQVAYIRADEKPVVSVADKQTAVDATVWSFFRDLRRVRELGFATGIPIDIISDAFDPRLRTDYESIVVRAIRAQLGTLLLYLDPDTGLQPRRANGCHVSRDEVQKYWSALRPGDVLALYQHARHNKTWIADVRSELSALCDDASVQVARSGDIGTDVALLFVKKC